MDLSALWPALIQPLLRLCFSISLGLLVGSFIEAMNWTRFIAKLVSPLVRVGHLKDVSGASFSLAFFSSATANTMLAEAHDQGKLSRSELILSNLFNSLPTLFLHLPTTVSVTVLVIGWAAVPYLGLVIGSTILRLIFVLGLSRVLLADNEKICVECELPEKKSFQAKDVVAKIWERFKKRIGKILMFTVPVYLAMYFMAKFGIFAAMEQWMTDHVMVLSWIHPEAIGIVLFQMTAEFSAGLAAAGALIEHGVLSTKEVVLALILGNILSSPMRIIRHQFPFYAGIFKPGLGGILIVYNQFLRVGSLVLVGAVYYLFG